MTYKVPSKADRQDDNIHYALEKAGQPKLKYRQSFCAFNSNQAESSRLHIENVHQTTTSRLRNAWSSTVRQVVEALQIKDRDMNKRHPGTYSTNPNWSMSLSRSKKSLPIKANDPRCDTSSRVVGTRLVRNKTFNSGQCNDFVVVRYIDDFSRMAKTESSCCGRCCEFHHPVLSSSSSRLLSMHCRTENTGYVDVSSANFDKSLQLWRARQNCSVAGNHPPALPPRPNRASCDNGDPTITGKSSLVFADTECPPGYYVKKGSCDETNRFEITGPHTPPGDVYTASKFVVRPSMSPDRGGQLDDDRYENTTIQSHRSDDGRRPRLAPKPKTRIHFSTNQYYNVAMAGENSKHLSLDRPRSHASQRSLDSDSKRTLISNESTQTVGEPAHRSTWYHNRANMTSPLAVYTSPLISEEGSAEQDDDVLGDERPDTFTRPNLGLSAVSTPGGLDKLCMDPPMVEKERNVSDNRCSWTTSEVSDSQTVKSERRLSARDVHTELLSPSKTRLHQAMQVQNNRWRMRHPLQASFESLDTLSSASFNSSVGSTISSTSVQSAMTGKTSSMSKSVHCLAPSRNSEIPATCGPKHRHSQSSISTVSADSGNGTLDLRRSLTLNANRLGTDDKMCDLDEVRTDLLNCIINSCDMIADRQLLCVQDLFAPCPRYQSDYLVGCWRIVEMPSSLVATSRPCAFADRPQQPGADRSLGTTSTPSTGGGDLEPRRRVSSPTTSNSTTMSTDTRQRLRQRKIELISRIRRKLAVLRHEIETVRSEEAENDRLGSSVLDAFDKSAATHGERLKVSLHVEEVGKVTSLLVSLSGRLAKAENSISSIDQITKAMQCSTESSLFTDASLQSRLEEKKSLSDKRLRLVEQLNEAKRLKESIDRRSTTVVSILSRYVDDRRCADYDQFISNKARLIVESREIVDKIELGEEQVNALQESIRRDEGVA